MKMQKVRGFSLVELMISLVLGTLVVAGVSQLFVANSEAYNLLEGQSRMQESARMSLEFIGRNARQAGYRGCFSRNDEIRSTILPVSSIPYEFDLRFAVAGYDAQGAGVWAPAIAAVLPSTNSSGVDTNVFKTTNGDGAGAGIDLGQIISGTDVITFRNLSQVEARLGVELLTEAADPRVHIGVGWNEFEKDHLVMIHDCEKGTIFRVTDLSPDLAGNPSASSQDLTIGHDMDDTDATRNSSLRLASTNNFNTDAAISAIESHTYFIAPGGGVNNAGQTPRSLWRKSGMQAPVELVEGVEDLQILYGVDTDNDRTPNQYLPANLVLDWRQLTTLNVTVVVNSIDDTGGTTMSSAGCPQPAGCAVDGLQRRTFTQTFQLRNHG